MWQDPGVWTGSETNPDQQQTLTLISVMTVTEHVHCLLDWSSLHFSPLCGDVSKSYSVRPCECSTFLWAVRWKDSEQFGPFGFLNSSEEKRKYSTFIHTVRNTRVHLYFDHVKILSDQLLLDLRSFRLIHIFTTLSVSVLIESFLCWFNSWSSHMDLTLFPVFEFSPQEWVKHGQLVLCASVCVYTIDNGD